MTHAEKHIIKTYSQIFERLSAISKLELLENLAKSIRKDTKGNEEDFFNSFGAFASKKSAEEIIEEIKDGRKFKAKDLNF